jgi:hypothetical protein
MNNKTLSSVYCVGCTKLFKRLSTHLAQDARCAPHYYCGHTSKASHKESVKTPTIPNDRNFLREATSSTCLNLSFSSSCCGSPPVRKTEIFGDNNLHVRNVHELDDDFVVDADDSNFVAFEDNHPDVPIDQDALKTKKTNVKLIAVSLILMRNC